MNLFAFKFQNNPALLQPASAAPAAASLVLAEAIPAEVPRREPSPLTPLFLIKQKLLYQKPPIGSVPEAS